MKDGDKAIRAFSVPNGVSHNMDTEISLSHPESWSKGILGKTFSGGNEGATWL